MKTPLQRYFIKSDIGIDSLEPSDAGYVMKVYDVENYLNDLNEDYYKACIYKEEIERLTALIILNEAVFNKNVNYIVTLEKALERCDQEKSIIKDMCIRAKKQNILAFFTIGLLVLDGALKYLGIL
jgi:hypothetical protein